MWRLVLALAMLPGAGLAQDWEILDGPGIAAALAARVVQYPDGASQNFFADGRTLYEGPGAIWGRWWVQGGQVCAVWPQSYRWTCSGVARRGLQVRFGAALVGQYVDLH